MQKLYFNQRYYNFFPRAFFYSAYKPPGIYIPPFTSPPPKTPYERCISLGQFAVFHFPK